MDSLISRQAAIDALQKAYVDTQEGFDKSAVKINVGLTKALHMIQDLPSAQQWIPVTERLPEKYIGKWICCMDDGTVDILAYDTPGDGSKECVFYYWQDDYTVVKPNVVAWMPLPDPWKGEQDVNAEP